MRIALQRWFSRVCDDPVLQKEDELRSFIESDFGYQPVPPPSSRRQGSSAGASFTAALSKIVRRGPLDDDDEIESARVTLEKLEPAWQNAASAVGNMGKVRKQLATANAEVGSRLITLATDEGDAVLATAERKMGRVYEQLAGMSSAQGASDNVILNDSLAYQATNAKSARDALAQRSIILEDSQSATKAAINKRRVVERLKGSSSINPAKVDEAITDMEEANAIETRLTSHITAISQNLHYALRGHSRSAHEDIAISLLEHARMSIIFNRQTLRELEALRPDLTRASNPVTSPLSQSAVAPPPPMAGAYTNTGPAAPQIPGMPNQAAQQASRPGFASTPVPAAGMAQSMFLPGQAGAGDLNRPRSAAGAPGGPLGGGPMTPSASSSGGPVDPLGGAPMAQSMMLPGRSGTPGRAPPRRLDERKAAKLLAGGF